VTDPVPRRILTPTGRVAHLVGRFQLIGLALFGLASSGLGAWTIVASSQGWGYWLVGAVELVWAVELIGVFLVVYVACGK
jgi:hypothetical protein